jgi:D-inositol-3-phosphate glycosyltransferase
MFHTLGQLKNASGSGADDADLRIVTEQEIIGNCDRIIANTAREKADLVSYYGAKDSDIGIVPCGVNMELFRPGEPAPVRTELGIGDGILLLFVGRIDPVKGLERLLKSMPFISTVRPAHLLVVGGDDSEQVELEKLRCLAGELGISDRVTFRGRVRQDNLAGYYRAADICVMPSYYESFGLVALESLASGTPVIASDVGEMSRIITNGVNGFVMPDNSLENIVKYTREAIGIFRDRQYSPEAVRASVKDYTWSAAARGVIDEIQTAIALEASAVG